MAVSLLEYQNQASTPMMQGIVQVVTNESVFMRRLNFVEITEFTYRYNRQQTLGGIAFRNFNQTYTADTGVVNPETESLRIFGGSVATDRQLAKGPTGTRVRSNNIASKMKKAALFFDKYVIDGDTASSSAQFDGLNVRLTGNQVISAGTNGAALTLAMLDQAIDRVVGGESNKIIVCNKAVRRKITTLVVAAAGGAAVLDVGSQKTSYNGVPIEVLDEDGDENAILGFDETQGNSSVATSLYVLRLGSSTDGEYLQGIVRNTGAGMVEHVDYGEQLGVYNDLVEGVMGIGVFHPRSGCRIKGILDS
jgi:hypothetical protein